MRSKIKESLFCKIFNTLAIILFFVLFYYSLSVTGIDHEIFVLERVLLQQNSIIDSILKLCGMLLLYMFLGRLAKYIESRKVRNIILGMACFVSCIISIYWVYASKSAPQADQRIICQYADAFNMGDFAGFNKGIYVARYPQQIGMITLLRVLFSFFGMYQYQSFQYMSALLVPLMVLSGCKIVRILSNDNVKAEVYYLVSILVCFPMYTYTSFVYGDFISTVFAMLAVWMYLSAVKSFAWYKVVLFGMFIGIAVQLRTNLLILVIAIAIVTILKLVFDRNCKNLVLLLALVIGVSTFYAAIGGLYYNVRKADAPAIPALLYVVMGLNDDYQRPGWHNNYEYATFALANDDVEVAKEKALVDLKMYVEIYRNDPQYMLDFFTRKMNAQWNAPMYQALSMNTNIEGTQTRIVSELYEENSRLNNLVEFVMKMLQMLTYGSILYWLVLKRKKLSNIENYVLLIAVFGGFIFSMIWEAKTRYVMPYFFMMLPHMALGVCEIVAYIEKKLSDKVYLEKSEKKNQ